MIGIFIGTVLGLLSLIWYPRMRQVNIKNGILIGAFGKGILCGLVMLAWPDQ